MTTALSLREILRAATLELRGISDSAYLDVQLLMAACLQCSKTELLLRADRQLNSAEIAAFNALLARRKQFEPVAYILQEKEFWGLNFKVSPAVLIPRPDTELIVEQGLSFIKSKAQPWRILDLGTGSGAIAISLAHELQKLKADFSVVATDLSLSALDLAQQNAKLNHCEQSIEFLQGSWFEPLHLRGQALQFDLIVSNPPYLAQGDPEICEETRRYEPASALYAGGADALDAVQILLEQAHTFLKVSGLLLIEFSPEQAPLVAKLEAYQKYYNNQRVLKDLAGRDRVLALYKK